MKNRIIAILSIIFICVMVGIISYLRVSKQNDLPKEVGTYTDKGSSNTGERINSEDTMGADEPLDEYYHRDITEAEMDNLNSIINKYSDTRVCQSI